MTLQEFFTLHPKAAVAFSGGVDSAYLLYAAKKYARQTKAYYVKSQFQPHFELRDAAKLAQELGVDFKILKQDVLSVPHVKENRADRCYVCKKAIFQTIMASARADGFPVLLDGTNASDDVKTRPGMRAMAELSVLSPLRECGLTKPKIRRLSKEAGLFTWDKPAYACLATRIFTGEEITAEKLVAAEAAEDYLFSLGFQDFRVRTHNGHAMLQLPLLQLARVLAYRSDIVAELKKYYQTVSLDLEARG